MSSPSVYCGSKAKVSGPQLCKWSGCEAYGNCTEFDSVEELARHVRTTHVEPLEVSKPYVFATEEIRFLFLLVSRCGGVSVGEVQGLQCSQLFHSMVEAPRPAGPH